MAENRYMATNSLIPTPPKDIGSCEESAIKGTAIISMSKETDGMARAFKTKNAAMLRKSHTSAESPKERRCTLLNSEKKSSLFLYFLGTKNFATTTNFSGKKNNDDKITKYRTNNILKIIGGAGMPKSKRDNPVSASP